MDSEWMKSVMQPSPVRYGERSSVYRPQLHSLRCVVDLLKTCCEKAAATNPQKI